jgi:hypothetical protein
MKAIQNQQDTGEIKMGDTYQEGFTDGARWAREEITERLREIDVMDIDSWLLDKLADMIEGGKL